MFCVQPHKIILGTAQFGLDYGVANKTGKLTYQECQDLLDFSKSISIAVLDTSLSYGDSQKVLGELNVNSFCMQTKINLGSDVPIDIQFDKILQQLRVSVLDSILIHDPWNITRDRKHDLLVLEELKRDKRVNKIGVSVYTENDLRVASDAMNLDIVQLPMNVFDQRFCDNALLVHLRELGTEVQARSIFLQGLLLMDSCDLPEYFNPWTKIFSQFENFCAERKITKLTACSQFIAMNKIIDNYVYGFENLEQLKMLLQSHHEVNYDYSQFKCEDEDLLLPMNWKFE